jgi:hypothetical protein
MQTTADSKNAIGPFIPDDLKPQTLAIPSLFKAGSMAGEFFRAIRVGRLPNKNDTGFYPTFQSRGLRQDAIHGISSSLLEIFERTTAETALLGDIPITPEVIRDIFDSERGTRVIKIMTSVENFEEQREALKTELSAFLDKDPFIFHSMMTTSNLPVGYYGGTSGRHDSPTVHHKMRSAHLLAQGMDEKATVASRAEASDFALDGAFIAGGKKGEIGLFSRKTGEYLDASVDLKLVLMAYMCSYSMPFANEAAEHDAFGHDGALQEVVGKIELPKIHRVAPDVLTSQNYLRWIGAYLVYRGGTYDPHEIPSFDTNFLATTGLETTGVDRMYGGFDEEIVDVSRVTAVGIFEESISALNLKGISPENAMFLLTGAGKVTQGMLEWALNRRHRMLDDSPRLRADQFTIVEPCDTPYDAVNDKFSGVTMYKGTGAGFLEGHGLRDTKVTNGRKFDILISNALGKDLKPIHIQLLHDAGVMHLSGAANVKLEPKSADESDELMLSLGMGTVSEYLINAGGWLCCMGDSLLREYYGGTIPQDKKFAKAYNKYVIDTIVKMNDENLRRSQERAKNDATGLNAASKAEIKDAVDAMRERYLGWSRALLYGDDDAKAEVLYNLQLCVGARAFLDRMISVFGFPKRDDGRQVYTPEQLNAALSHARK